MNCNNSTVNHKVQLTLVIPFVVGICVIAATGIAAHREGTIESALVAGLLAVTAVEILKYGFTRCHLSLREFFQDALVVGILAASADTGMKVWQAPTSGYDLLSMTDAAAALGIIIYLASVTYSLATSGHHLSLIAGSCIALVPYLFNALLLLGSPALVPHLGRDLTFGVSTNALLHMASKAVVLIGINEIIAALISLLIAARLISDVRVHALLIGSALYAVLTPSIAGWGSGATVAALPKIPQLLSVLTFAVLSLAGLWAQTYLLTGLFMDALHGKEPTWYWGSSHYAGGFVKGSIYSGIFMAIILVAASIFAIPTAISVLTSYPFISACLIGSIVFPLFKTIVESFDGSTPFFKRLLYSYTDYLYYLRGAVVGAGVAYALREKMLGSGGPERFCYGLAMGAVAFAGVDLVRDTLDIVVRRRRIRLQAWKVYGVKALLGGVAGGALAWYSDGIQVEVVISKFKHYAAIYYPMSGKVPEEYIIYPLFSKWGAMNLGTVTGGVRLLYNEALSGVINWSIAAPLFSINLMVLTALVERSTIPLKRLFTRRGVVEIVEQAIRVQRWGLWMAPVIYSFLRMSPVPTWYNQDGAIRAAVATFKSWTLSPEAFRAWSLQTFINLLAYDWLRIFIWLDHMGLRVATLVNLSFVGVDLLDEKTARFIGHSGRTRAIPHGLRRFATWAPLIIPFYIPRGAEWNYAWSQAEALGGSTGREVLSPLILSTGFITVALVVGIVWCIRQLRSRVQENRKQPSWGHLEQMGKIPDDKTFVLSNGVYTFALMSDGRGWSRVFSLLRKGAELDITRRADDPLQLCGKFFYLADKGKPQDSTERIWSLCYQPTRRSGEDYTVTRPDRLSLEIINTYGGIRAHATVRLDEHDPVEVWRINLKNLEDRTRTIELTSYREFTLNAPDAHLRHPDYNSIHIGTCFIKSLNAIIARNRQLKDNHKNPLRRRASPEVGFHAVKESADGSVKLIGYEDSRPFFLGHQTLHMPQGLEKELRSPEHEGLLYTFDPIASLRLKAVLAPNGSTEILFVDGYARSEGQAVRMIQDYLGLPREDGQEIRSAFTRQRTLHGFNASLLCDGRNRENATPQALPAVTTPLFSFSQDGTELHLRGNSTLRPWAHLLANELGYGSVVTDEGNIYSFMGNSQQNGLTPFMVNSVPIQVPGQVLYLMNMSTGEVDGPTFIPFNKNSESCEVTYGRGYATFRKKGKGMEMELTVFVLPDKPAEVRLLTIRNLTASPVTYRVVPYLQIMLGEVPRDTRGRIQTHYDEVRQTLFFSNPQNDFQKGWAFVAMNLPVDAYETVRSRFVGGTDRDLTNPLMVECGVPDLSQPDDGYRVAAFVGTITVPAGGEETVSVVVGQVEDRQHAADIILRYRDVRAAEHTLQKTKGWWQEMLSTLRIETNNPAFDRMVNDWLPYQVLASHLWGRTGPNQRGGGYGFRDQLQDVLPFLITYPLIARTQILLHSAQQFFEGDVMQWWHQSWEGKTGLGTRNRASDPHLWLPYLVYHYVQATGDQTILDERVPFLEGKRIPRGMEGILFAPRPSRDEVTLYRHCLRAIDFSLRRTGPHGLPLIGTGDWNDALNLVGSQGRGESVWLGFFMYDILIHFAELIELKEGDARKGHYLEKAARLKDALDKMWRGERYVRAITDDGQEMVFADALISAWPVISGAVHFERGAQAVEEGLKVLEKEHIMLLLSPPFSDTSNPFPGKLADYPPGVRENGGQYSHGVSWLVDALIQLAVMAEAAGDRERADRYRAKAMEVWCKISPLNHSTPEEITKYGLPPHQQPADVYHGPSHEGRGGWSWYTGSAGRMLQGAYEILGLKMWDGKMIVPEDLFKPKGTLQVKRLVYRGKEYRPSAEQLALPFDDKE